MSTSDESLKETGRCAAAAIVEMVAALECDYDRLEELRDSGITKVTAPSAWASYLINGDASGISDTEAKEADAMVAEINLGAPTGCDDAGFVTHPDYGALAGDCQTYTFYDSTIWDEATRAEFAELEEAAGECTSREEAETRIQEDALSVEVRGGWYDPSQIGTEPPEEFQILLSTGGPASRIRGELTDGEPCRAWLEVQDWGTPWTQVFGIEQDTLLAYARCFYYGEG